MTDCFEIMTGAVIPHGCDAVIPIEYVRIFDHQALVSSDAKVQRLQFVRKQGSEYKKGALLIENGIRINPTHISVAASVGKCKVKIFSPRIAVIGTGDELVELNKNPKIHQSRRSNAYALEAIFLTHGFSDVRRFHIADNLIQLQKVLKKILNHYDVLVLIGGVSMGKFDLIPKVLGELGVKTLFHKVRQKPGQPLLFAQNRHGKVIFGLPGNPVSTIVCSVRYVVPYLNKICGLNAKRSTVRLASPVQQHPSLALFLPSQFNKNGQVAPVVFAGSGDYSALTQSDGFIEIPLGKGRLKKETEVQFFSW